MRITKRKQNKIYKYQQKEIFKAGILNKIEKKKNNPGQIHSSLQALCVSYARYGKQRESIDKAGAKRSDLGKVDPFPYKIINTNCTNQKMKVLIELE